MKADKFIMRIFNKIFHVVWVCIVGVNQSGKTDLALFIMERLHALGLADGFGSNVPVKANFEIDHIEDFQTLKHRCQMLNPNPDKYGLKRYFFFASEMGKWAAQDLPWKNTSLIREMQLVRKYGLSVIGDGIDRIDKRIFSPSHFHGFFEKQSKEKPQNAVYIDWTKRGKKTVIKGIPRTSIEFDTFHSARFTMEPTTPEDIAIPLNREHELVKLWLDVGSWDKAGVHRQEGKRALRKVLDFHFTHCLHKLPQDKIASEPIDAEI